MQIRTLLLSSTIAGVALGFAWQAFAAQATTRTTTTRTTTVATSAAAPAPDAASKATVDAMQSQIQTMETQINYMRRQIELMQEQVPPKPPATGAKTTLAGARPAFVSNDGNFKFDIQGRVHNDYAQYFGVQPGMSLNNGFNIRRAYVSFNANFYKDWDATLEADFGGSSGEAKTNFLRTALLTWNGANAGLGNFKIDIGVMEPQVTFERAISSNNLYLMERSTPELVAQSLAADDRREAIGIRNNGSNWMMNLYYTGARTASGGSQDNVSNEGSAIIGRLGFAPYMDTDTNAAIHLGINGQYKLQPDQLNNAQAAPRRRVSFGGRPGLTVDGTSFISTGNISANSGSVLGGELAGSLGSFSAFAQYFMYNINTVNPPGGITGTPTLDFDGFDVTASYVLTGERRTYSAATGAFGGVRPANNLGPNGMGAFELVARFEQTNLNNRAGGYLVEGGRQTLYQVGLNWYINPAVRFMINYIYADIRRARVVGAGTTAYLDAPTPGSNLSPHLNAIGTRVQFNF